MVAYESHSIGSARFCGGSLGSSKNFCLHQCVIATWSDGTQFANAHNSRPSTTGGSTLEGQKLPAQSLLEWQKSYVVMQISRIIILLGAKA